MPYPSLDLLPASVLYPFDPPGAGPTGLPPGTPAPPGSWMAMEIYAPEGVRRFGPDGTPCWSLNFQTRSAGGYAQASVTVPEPLWAVREDLLFCPVRFYGPGGETRYEGRVSDVSQADQHATRIDCEGWAATLDDNQFFREVYVDRDLSKWAAMSDTFRQIVLLFGITPSDGQMQPDTSGDQTLLMAIAGNGSAIDQEQRLHYSAPVELGSVYYEWELGANIDATWTAEIQGDALSDFSTATATGDLTGSASSSGTFTLGELARYLAVYLRTPAGSGGTNGLSHEARFKNVAVFGAHGLDKRGTAPNEGFYPGDIIIDAIEQGAPLLRIIEGDVERGGTIVQQAAYVEGQTVRSVIEDAGQYGTPDQQVAEWGVYEDQRYFWRSPGSAGTQWRVRRDQMAVPTNDGPAAAERFAEVVVRWQDATGQEFTVGAPGSGADTEDERLRADDWLNNPAASIPLRRKLVNAGQTYEEGAVLLGQAELAEINARERRGTAVLNGPIRDLAGNLSDSSAVRACDTLVVEDEHGVTAPEVQYVNGTTYDHDTGTTTATLGVEPLALEIALAKLRNAVGV